MARKNLIIKDLKTLSDVRAEMSRVYYEARSGQLEISEGSKYIYMLDKIGAVIMRERELTISEGVADKMAHFKLEMRRLSDDESESLLKLLGKADAGYLNRTVDAEDAAIINADDDITDVEEINH